MYKKIKIKLDTQLKRFLRRSGFTLVIKKKNSEKNYTQKIKLEINRLSKQIGEKRKRKMSYGLGQGYFQSN